MPRIKAKPKKPRRPSREIREHVSLSDHVEQHERDPSPSTPIREVTRLPRGSNA